MLKCYRSVQIIYQYTICDIMLQLQLQLWHTTPFSLMKSLLLLFCKAICYNQLIHKRCFSLDPNLPNLCGPYGKTKNTVNSNLIKLASALSQNIFSFIKNIKYISYCECFLYCWSLKLLRVWTFFFFFFFSNHLGKSDFEGVLTHANFIFIKE